MNCHFLTYRQPQVNPLISSFINTGRLALSFQHVIHEPCNSISTHQSSIPHYDMKLFEGIQAGRYERHTAPNINTHVKSDHWLRH